MNRLKYFLIAIFTLSASFVWDNASPVPMLEQSAAKIIANLKQNQAQLKTNKSLIHQAIVTYLLPHVDVQGMARSVLGREAWRKASASDKKEFTKAFTSLVVRTYANPLSEYSGETVKFSPVRMMPNQKFIRVNSVIHRPNGQKIPLSYQMVLKNGQWMVYDLNVEGVSLLQSFHAQCADALKKSSMHDLIVELQHTKKAA